MIRDYALSEALLRESREKQELIGLQSHLTTDQVRWLKAPVGWRNADVRVQVSTRHPPPPAGPSFSGTRDADHH